MISSAAHPRWPLLPPFWIWFPSITQTWDFSAETRFWSPKVRSRDSCKTAIKSVGCPTWSFWRSQLRTQPFQVSLGRVEIVYPFQETMSSPTNEIKASAKLPSMPFPYLVTQLILLPFVLFRKHSGLVRHNLCGATWIPLAGVIYMICIGGKPVPTGTCRFADLGVSSAPGSGVVMITSAVRKCAGRWDFLWRSLIPTFFMRGGTHPRAPPARPSVSRSALRPQFRLIFRNIGLWPISCLITGQMLG
jgi:hypothetical protein